MTPTTTPTIWGPDSPLDDGEAVGEGEDAEARSCGALTDTEVNTLHAGTNRGRTNT